MLFEMTFLSILPVPGRNSATLEHCSSARRDSASHQILCSRCGIIFAPTSMLRDPGPSWPLRTGKCATLLISPFKGRVPHKIFTCFWFSCNYRWFTISLIYDVLVHYFDIYSTNRKHEYVKNSECIWSFIMLSRSEKCQNKRYVTYAGFNTVCSHKIIRTSKLASNLRSTPYNIGPVQICKKCIQFKIIVHNHSFYFLFSGVYFGVYLLYLLSWNLLATPVLSLKRRSISQILFEDINSVLSKNFIKNFSPSYKMNY